MDPMVALVESWGTFLVPPAEASQNAKESCHDTDACMSELAWAASSAPSRFYLNDARPPLFFSDEIGGSPSTPTNGHNPSLLWLLTLVSRNVELLRAAAHLFLQFNAQFATLVDTNEKAINSLRERHQQQLASLLEVANSYTKSNMIVDSTVTERVVHQQEQELVCLERECAAAERQLELQLQSTLLAFLNTSAPDAVAAANRREDTLMWATAPTSTTPANISNSNSNSSPFGGGGDGLYRAEVDVSRFAEVRKPVPRNAHQSTSAVAPYSPVRLVPVRTIKLNNEVGTASSSAANSPTRKRSNDVTLQPIILDVSPLSGLTRCLTCCSGTQPGAISSSVSSAAEEHLLRLAHTRHSVLLLIGTEAAAMDVVASCKAPELLLGASHTCREGFRPLPHHPMLRVLFTTRLWGANVVLLWNPSQESTRASNVAPMPAPPSSASLTAATAAQTVVEDAMELAYAWDADMFSVAVLEGARLPTSQQPDRGRAEAVSSTPTPAAAFFAAQAMSMEVLRQLRNGVTRELLETAGTRRSRCWQGSTAWLQLGGGAATTAGTHMCPRAVGVVYASQAAAAAPGAAATATRTAFAPIVAAATPASPVASSTASSPLASTAAAFRGPPVTFNTPLAIRAFLPLPEEYFIKARPSREVVEDGRNRNGEVGSNAGVSDSYAPQHGAFQGRSGRGSGGSGGRMNMVPATPLSDTEDSATYETDVLQSSFTSASSPRASRSGFGGTDRGCFAGDADSYTSASFLNDRQRESMGLEALVHYAFGEFAQAL